MTEPILDTNDDLFNSSKADWARMLKLFCRSSGLTASLYSPTGERMVGPFSGSPFGNYLMDSGIFNEGMIAQQFESSTINKLGSCEVTHVTSFLKSFSVRFLPVQTRGTCFGYVVFGWVFDRFPDPVECSKLAKKFGKFETEFWQAARIQSPTSSEKLQTYQEMLDLLVSTLLQQLLLIREAHLNARRKDELLAVVSHELKTPLTSILLRVQMLKRNNISVDRLKEFAQVLESNVLTQVQLIEDLLDAGKIITGKFTLLTSMIDLQTILESCVQTIQDAADKRNISIKKIGFEEKCPFLGDEGRLRQAFLNILTNALKFTPDHGHISVRITKNISSYIIQFQDDGVGIDASFIPNMFNKFSQYMPTEGSVAIGQGNAGLGLGLSIVKTIIGFHHGSIEVESEGLGKGTIFEINLPILN